MVNVDLCFVTVGSEMTLAPTTAESTITMAMPTSSNTQDVSEQEHRISSYLFDDPRKKSRNYLDTHKNIEKKRRDRINSSLTALKSIIPECKAYGKKKLDKAEILDMTLSYLDKIHSSGFTLKKEEQQTPANWAKQLMQWVHQEKKNYHTVDEFVNALLTHLQTCVVSGSFAPVDLKGMLQGTLGQETPVSQSVVTCQAQPTVTNSTPGVPSPSSQSHVTTSCPVSPSQANTVTSIASGSHQNGLMRARPPPPPNITPAIFLQATSFQARLRAQATSHISSTPSMQQQVFPSAAIILQPQQQQQQQQTIPTQQVINVTQPIDLTQQCSKQRDVLDLRMTSQGREQLVASNQCIQRLQQLIDQHSMQEQSLMQVQPQNVQMPNAVPYMDSGTNEQPAYTQNMAGSVQGSDLSFINSSSQAYILAELPAGVLLQDRMLGSVGEMLPDGTAMDTVASVPTNADSDASFPNPEQLQVPGMGESPVTELVDPGALHVSAVVDDSALIGTPDLPSWSNSPISALEQAPT